VDFMWIATRDKGESFAVAYPIQRKRKGESFAVDDPGYYFRKRQGQSSMRGILDDTTSPSLRDNGGVERNRRKRR